MSKPLRLGVAGLGTVGASVVRIVKANAESLAARAERPVVVTAVLARDRTKDRGVDLSALRWHDDPVALAEDPEVDAVVEVIGGESGAAETVVRAALSAGKPVVTANKALIARHGLDLARMAEEKGVAIAFEAAVAGGIPVIKALKESLAANRIDRVYGILNGTCNYMLTRMETAGLSYEVSLAEAQQLGYAEADPTFDVAGFDAAHKLAILTSLAFGTRIDAEAIYVEGITAIEAADIRAADELGYRIKLLGVARRTETGIEARVHPAMVPKSSAIARIDGVLNAVALDGDVVGEILLVGPGAGGGPTASSVIADIVDVARGHAVPAFGRPVRELQPYRRAEIQAHQGGYYVRLAVEDRPGAFAAIAARMAEQGISLESIVQRKRQPSREGAFLGEPATAQPVVLITYATTEAAIRSALDNIQTDGHIASVPRVIRIEEF